MLYFGAQDMVAEYFVFLSYNMAVGEMMRLGPWDSEDMPRYELELDPAGEVSLYASLGKVVMLLDLVGFKETPEGTVCNTHG